MNSGFVLRGSTPSYRKNDVYENNRFKLIYHNTHCALRCTPTMLALKCLTIEIASVGEVASARVCTHVNVYAITITKTPSDVIVSPVGFVPIDCVYPVHYFF